MAGQRDTGLLRDALATLGDRCPDSYRRVAEARIASPGASWRQVAAALGMTKDQAAGIYRRLLTLARQEHPGGQTPPSRSELAARAARARWNRGAP